MKLSACKYVVVLETVVGARFGYGFQDISSGIADLEKTTQYFREIK